MSKEEMLEKEVVDLKNRIAALESGFISLNKQYNEHIRDLHINKIDQRPRM